MTRALGLSFAGILRSQDVRDRLAAEGTEALTTTSSALTEILKSETARWAKVIKAANITLE
jgi:tripartite-type tricarboxylate transporter receptor subunit TctC